MKYKVLNLIATLAALGFALLSTGCAGLAAYPLSAAASIFTPSGAIEIRNQTAVRLDQANFVVVQTNAVGQAKGFALLGLITLVPAKFSTAMDRFYANAGMEPGKPQALADIVMEKSSTYWILFSIPQVSFRADVVEFVPALPDEPPPMPTEVEKRRPPIPVPEEVSGTVQRHRL